MDQLNFPWSIFFGSIILRILRHCYVLTMACRNEDLFQLWVSRHCSQFCCPLNFHPQPIFLSNKIAELEVEWTCHWRSRRLSCTARCLVGPWQQLGSGNRGFPTNSHWGKGWPDMGFRGTLPAFDGRNPSIFNWSIHITMGLIHQHGWPSNFVIFPYIFPMNLLFSTMFFMFSSLFREIRDHFPCLWFLPYDIWSIFCNLTVSCGNKTTFFSTRWRRTATLRARRPLRPQHAAFSVAFGATVLLQVSVDGIADMVNIQKTTEITIFNR